MRPNPQPVKPDAAKPLVLIVDDSDGARAVIRATLAVLDVKIREAADGDTALAMLADRDYDLVITDLEMSPCSGFDLIKEINALPVERARPQVIVCSSLVGTHAVNGRTELNAATALVPKPVRVDELLGEVIKALEET